MSYDLYIGEYAYSSWSLRGWLLFRRFGISCRIHLVDFTDETGVAGQLSALSPARTVPAIRTNDGAVISESLAIAEELATRHPDAGLWPADPKARATARNLATEMHAGFAALREHCPMNLRTAYANVPVPKAVQLDLDRIEVLWSHARATCPSSKPWLCGTYSVADVFFAPVAMRIAGYGLHMSPTAQAYVDAHLADPAFRRWRAMGRVRGNHLPWYDRDYDQRPWPGPTPIPAKAVDAGPSENTACPYSGDPVTHYMETGGRVFGFCNAFCRDKTVADPEAWPEFIALRDGH